MLKTKRTKREIMQGRDGDLWVFSNNIKGINQVYELWGATGEIYSTSDKYYAFRRDIVYTPDPYDDK